MIEFGTPSHLHWTICFLYGVSVAVACSNVESYIVLLKYFAPSAALGSATQYKEQRAADLPSPDALNITIDEAIFSSWTF